MALTRLAQQSIRAHFAKLDVAHTPLQLAVDATCGNGHDTAFLFSMGFQQVLGFDIQQAALEATRQRIAEAEARSQTRIRLHLASHAELGEYVESNIDCVMFNLGYLPHGDKSITTLAVSSTRAISQALSKLNPWGIATILCYPGHDAGATELKAVVELLNTLGPEFCVEHMLSTSPSLVAPQLFVVKPTQV